MLSIIIISHQCAWGGCDDRGFEDLHVQRKYRVAPAKNTDVIGGSKDAFLELDICFLSLSIQLGHVDA